MALSVVKRPQGYVLSDTASSNITFSDWPSSPGLLLITHDGSFGVSTGTYVYIYSNIDSYNGYWYAENQSGTEFTIKEYATSSYVPFTKTGSGSFYINFLSHNWNCVHLPIIYKLKSDVWPTNGADTARSISTFSNYNGYTYLVADGDIKATGTASSLEQVILSGCTNAGVSIDGVYKILQWFSDTNFIINLPYSAANVFTSGTVQYYYYNYCARIKVYAGIATGHTWDDKKPIELVTEQRFIPDSSGLITLNISEFIKKKIETISNNSILGTLPNNIDAWCNFYITYAESYDDSNMYTVEEYVSSYTDDSGTFIGYAVNAKLPFKTKSSGFLSDYVYGNTNGTLQKWLTAFANPVLFPGKYFDISYIKNTASAGDYIKREVYTTDGANYTLRQVYNDTVTDNDQGVYRYSIEQSGWGEERIDITYYNSSNVALSETLTIYVDESCSAQDFYLVWLNYLGGYDYWNFTARKQYSIGITENKTQEANIFQTWPNSYGEFADSIVKQTVRTGQNQVKVSSQLLSTAQEDAIKLLFVSPLVQICTSQYDRRTVLVNAGTLPVRRDQDKTRKLSFDVTYTDELPSQSL